MYKSYDKCQTLAPNEEVSKHRPVKRPRKSALEGHYCHKCGTTETPEWRKGPDGPKTLCNACGLAYSKRLKRGKYSSDEEIRRMRQAEKTLDRKELIETLSARDYDEPEFEPEEVAVPEGGVGPQQMEEPIARGELSKLLSEYSNFFSDI
ncbi:hypothetical protein RCL1_003886 [Eukaryota sp. TZLM3-RCL]